MRNKELLSGSIKVTKGVTYSLKVEVLRNDLGDSNEKVASITVDGREVGKKDGAACNPDGGDSDCTFFDCEAQLSENLVVTANSSTIKVALDFKEHSWACDCDKKTWKCSKKGSKKGGEMEAVARVTLRQVESPPVTTQCKCDTKSWKCASNPKVSTCAGVAPYTKWSDQSSDPKHGNACFKPGGPGKGGGDWQCPVGCKKVSSAPWCVEAKNNTAICRVAEKVAGDLPAS